MLLGTAIVLLVERPAQPQSDGSLTLDALSPDRRQLLNNR
jgi:hypothetical protein